MFGAKRQPRAHGQHVGVDAEQIARCLLDEIDDLLKLRSIAEDIDLVQDDDDLLAPVANRRQEYSFGLGKRAVGGCHEQHEIGSRNKVGGKAFMLADDRVGARRVDDVDVAKQLHRCGQDAQTIGIGFRFHDVAIFQQLDLRCGRGDALLHDGSPEQAIDERALSGVEFANADDQKQLVELADRRSQGGAILRRGAEFRERVTQSRQQLARLRELSLGGRFEYPQHG